ncbi:MAG: hypothetical protein HY934_03075 [Candidatus Firestonebacteria bacterium]|nr:hypothetical protein [Candidatus Firestonebacteria bacterium]
MPTILLTDGELNKTLAATRALGKKGYKVIVGDERKHNTSASSKYCFKSIVYPSPKKYPKEFCNI